MKQEKINIILPAKIGDTVLAIPYLICLKELQAKYRSNDLDITIYTSNELKDVFDAYGLNRIKYLGISEKIKSWFFKADKAFFLFTSTKNLGFKAKKTYGEFNTFKKYLKYDVNTPFLNYVYLKKDMPVELYNFLETDKKLCPCSVRYFGTLLDMGFTIEQIIETFEFSKDKLIKIQEYSNFSIELFNKKYLVFCMEAASNAARDADRRWNQDYYIELAERAYAQFGFECAFIGINKTYKITDKPYFHDFRGDLSVADSTKLMEKSVGYVGNDTGPLHLANLMLRPAVAIYSRKNTLTEYNPLVAELVQQLYNPQSIEEVYEKMVKVWG